ncbi:hypothetical protein [Bremerella alba]|uniref:Copper resistance protein D domain-containing protein n=1 Tax=Bremerella alba TaxID=980252 RepID=A0A7V9A6J9_9BACT|nr:hypothetical protein [Bremerella alba]MBA2114353.1 hypothetical protein [Bremerella alba]
MHFLLELIIRWAHIIPAIILVGGTLYMVLALRPAIQATEFSEKDELKSAIRARWAKVVMICAGIILLSGIASLVLQATTYTFPQKYYHPVAGMKFLLALVILYIASLLSGRSKNAEKFREKEAFWLKLNATLAVILVLMAGTLRVADRVPKNADSADSEVLAPSQEGVTGENS